MIIGAFSVSLSVKDIYKSRVFYEKLGFASFAGDINHNWLMMKNGDCVIGLFQKMFPKNLLTFNPGWDQNANNLDDYTDIREWQKHLKTQGVEIINEAEENSTGPASFMVMDPDGNPILFDQHR